MQITTHAVETQWYSILVCPHLLFLLFISFLLQIHRGGQIFPNWSLFGGLTH